jgi:hypothetical protein
MWKPQMHPQDLPDGRETKFLMFSSKNANFPLVSTSAFSKLMESTAKFDV